MVDDQKNGRNESNNNEIHMGVELDEFHRPVAYYVLTEHPMIASSKAQEQESM